MPGSTGVGNAAVAQHEGRVPVLAGVLGPRGHRSARGGQPDPILFQAPNPLDARGLRALEEGDAHPLGHAEEERGWHLAGV